MAIQITSEMFDTGRFDETASYVDGTTVRIVPRRDFENRSRWYCIGLQGVQGQALTIELDVTGYAYDTGPTKRLACFGYDLHGDEWHDFPSRSGPSGNIITFSGATFEQDTAYIALWPPHTVGRMEAKINTWKASPYFLNTPSAPGSDHVYASLAGRSTTWGKPVPSLDAYAWRITNDAITAPKNRAVWLVGVHPYETPGHWAFEGAVDFLLSDDPKASLVRNSFEIYCYTVSPLSKWGGMGRENIDTNSDNNRGWEESGGNEERDAAKAAILQDVPAGGALESFLDWHCFASWWNNNRHTLVDMGLHSNDVLTPILQAYYPPFNLYDSTKSATNQPSQAWASDQWSGGLIWGTVELANRAEYGVNDHRDHGGHYVQAMGDLLTNGIFPHVGAGANLLTFAPAPSEPLTFAPAGALNEEPEAPSAAPAVTLTPASQTALNLSLSEVDGATGYRYRVGTSGSWTDLGSGRTAQITGLSPGTSYTVQARAYNSAGDGPIGSGAASTLEPEGEVAIQLAATATVTTSASAGLRRRVQPVGITEVTSGVSGALTRRVRLHSRAAAYTGANGAILRSVRVVGSARAASAAHATLSVGEPLPHPTTLGVTIEDIYTLAAIIED